jgi:proline iminopeptidase
MKTTLIFSILFLLASQTQMLESQMKDSEFRKNEFGVPQYSEVQTGGVKIIQVDGKYNVWTKKIGNGDIKVLLLHGGPGFGHEYMECFESFLPPAGIEIYEYAQLGNFNSDQPNDPSLWTVDRYREEVEKVRKGLGLDHFYIVGHSWGGMLGMEYALKYQKHLKGLVISNMTASIPSYVKYVNELRSKFPADTIAKLDQYEKEEKYDAPEYQEIVMNVLYQQHICRLNPWPDPLLRSFKHFNVQIYNTMQGPNEFVVTGNFKDWDVWGKLSTIQVPTLVIGAKFDTMSLDDKKRMASLIPNSRLLICEGSHLAMYDDQQNYFNGLIRFLKEVHTGKFTKAVPELLED